jgi:hypothetical protein
VPDQAVRHAPGRLDHARVHTGHVDRQVGAQRRRHRGGRPDDDAVEAPLVLDRALVQRQQPADERHELLHATRRVLPVDAVPVALHALGAGAEPEDQPAAGELVEVARLRGQDQRGPAEGVRDRAPDRDRLGGVRHRGERDGGGAVRELGRPDGLEPRGLGEPRRLDGLVDARKRQHQRRARRRVLVGGRGHAAQASLRRVPRGGRLRGAVPV